SFRNSHTFSHQLAQTVPFRLRLLPRSRKAVNGKETAEEKRSKRTNEPARFWFRFCRTESASQISSAPRHPHKHFNIQQEPRSQRSSQSTGYKEPPQPTPRKCFSKLVYDGRQLSKHRQNRGWSLEFHRPRRATNRE